MKQDNIICKNCVWYYNSPHITVCDSFADENGEVSGYCTIDQDDEIEVNFDWHCAAFEEVQRND